MLHRPHPVLGGRRLAALVLAAGLSLSACAPPDDEGDATGATDDSSDAGQSPAPSPSGSGEPPKRSSPRPTVEKSPEPGLEVTISGTDVGPNAEEVELAVGEPLLISFDADRAGELHVHSKPEQYVEFPAGRSTQELVIETPGTVEVEEHDSAAVVAVIEVR